MGKLTDKVEATLQREEQTRNDDVALILEIYNYYYNLEYNLGYRMSLKKLEEIMRDSKPDEIVRVRRRFNQQGKYLATDPFVLKKRKQKINKMRKELGYKPVPISRQDKLI